MPEIGARFLKIQRSSDPGQPSAPVFMGPVFSIDQHVRPHFDVPIPPPTLDLLERVGEKLNTYVHFSGQYAFSHKPYPHPDMAPVAQRLYKIFGPERMLGASDFPWILEVPGYEEQLNLVDIMLPDLSEKELNLIKGGNAEILFNF